MKNTVNVVALRGGSLRWDEMISRAHVTLYMRGAIVRPKLNKHHLHPRTPARTANSCSVAGTVSSIQNTARELENGTESVPPIP